MFNKWSNSLKNEVARLENVLNLKTHISAITKVDVATLQLTIDFHYCVAKKINRGKHCNLEMPNTTNCPYSMTTADSK